VPATITHRIAANLHPGPPRPNPPRRRLPRPRQPRRRHSRACASGTGRGA